MQPLLVRNDRSPSRIVTELPDLGDTTAPAGIRCPHCAWRPSPSDRWTCFWSPPEPRFPSCGAVWNTFETRGACPGCGHQWQWTSCLRCAQWSLHTDWYEPAGDPDSTT